MYYDPWLAGVVFPGLIIVGLGAIPYIDNNPKGNGYYTLKERKWEIGNVPVWLPDSLDPAGHSRNVPARTELELLRTVRVLGSPQARSAEQHQPVGDHLDQDAGHGAAAIRLIREIFGIILVLAYLLVLPPLFAKKWFKGFYASLGPIRFYVMMFLLLCMAALPIKMVLRWLFNLKYIVGIPEYFFNI